LQGVQTFVQGVQTFVQRMVSVCVWHFDFYNTKEQCNECKYPVSGSVRFRSEQISAFTDSGTEHFPPDRTNTILRLQTKPS